MHQLGSTCHGPNNCDICTAVLQKYSIKVVLKTSHLEALDKKKDLWRTPGKDRGLLLEGMQDASHLQGGVEGQTSKWWLDQLHGWELQMRHLN
jgi:hypothetical protein